MRPGKERKADAKSDLQSAFPSHAFGYGVRVNVIQFACRYLCNLSNMVTIRGDYCGSRNDFGVVFLVEGQLS